MTRFTIALIVAAALGGPMSAPSAATPPAPVERGQIVTEGIPELPAALLARLSQYQNARAAGLADWLPAGRGAIITTRFGDTYQLHHVAGPGGARRQLTFFDEPVTSAVVNPDPATEVLLYLKDTGGSEFDQLYLFDLKTGGHRLLSDGTSQNGTPLWTRDGQRFAYASTRRNGADRDIYVAGLATPDAPEMVLAEGGYWYPVDWSPDGSRLLVIRYISRNQSEPYVLDPDSGALGRVLPDGVDAAVGVALFDASGRGVYFTSDHDSEFLKLRHRDLDSGAIRELTADVDWDVEKVALSDDGRLLAFTINESGASRLRVYDTIDMALMTVPQLPVGRVGALLFAPGGYQLGLTLNTPRSPNDVYSIDFDENALLRWTHSETGGLPADNLADPVMFRYPTFDMIDGQPRAIPAFFYKPPGDGPFPVVVSIHGGPESQARPGYSTLTQYMVNELGLAVVVPNVRGSSGYGKSYLLLDNGYRREDSVRDIGALLDWIEAQPELDPDRVAVIGGSYGGYMVLASMIRYSDRLRAGIDVVGISNFVTFLENTEDYRRDLRRQEYGDERDPAMREFLQQISPTRHSHKIARPLFIAQGLNDPRVPVTESEQMVKAIREAGGSVWYMLAKNEGHGFAKKENRDYYRAAAMMFLERYLVSGDPALPVEVAAD